ncbi:MAG: hypothetical protein ACM3PU_02440 [Gemmatimonadota bacterium]
MKPMLLLLSSLPMALAGCASMDPTASAGQNIDQAKVTAVESAARNSGVQVYWLNYPRKKAER